MFTIAFILRLLFFNKEHVPVLSRFAEMKFVKHFCYNCLNCDFNNILFTQ